MIGGSMHKGDAIKAMYDSRFDDSDRKDSIQTITMNGAIETGVSPNKK